MVSKSKILGKPTLVFITVGSTDFQFDRLLSKTDQALASFNENIKVIVQCGKSNYKWVYKNVRLFNYLNPGQLLFYIRKADKIISQTGPVSNFQITKHAKNMPLLIPRLAKYYEHVDNHQLFFAKFLKNQLPKESEKYIIDADIKLEINDYLKNKSQKNSLSKHLFQNSNEIKILSNLSKFLVKNKE